MEGDGEDEIDVDCMLYVSSLAIGECRSSQNNSHLRDCV